MNTLAEIIKDSFNSDHGRWFVVKRSDGMPLAKPLYRFEPSTPAGWATVTLIAAWQGYETDPDHGVNDNGIDDNGNCKPFEFPEGFLDRLLVDELQEDFIADQRTDDPESAETSQEASDAYQAAYDPEPAETSQEAAGASQEPADEDHATNSATARLWGSERLQSRPDAKVVLVQTEEEAEAALLVFEDCVVVAPAAGVDLVQDDLQPVAGHSVIVWANCNAEGGAFTRRVGPWLKILGADVKRVDTAALSGIGTRGQDVARAAAFSVAEAVERWDGLLPQLREHIDKLESREGLYDEPEEPTAEQEAPHAGNNTNEHLTDLGNAYRLARHCDGNIRYVHALRSWFIWNGKYWERDTNGEIYRLAHQTVEQIFQDSSRIEDEAQRTALRKFALASEKRAAFENMVALAQNLPGIPLSHEKLDSDPYLLGVKNGVVDLKTGKFRPARREDFITKQANVVFEPYADCPNWQTFQLKIACGDVDLVSFKQRVFGAVLSGLFIEALFIQHGGGSNGKTTETETIAHIMGDYSSVADSQIMMAPHNHGGATPELAGLKGKRFTCINESAENDTLNEARVKYITTNGAISARNIYEGLITFNPTHKLFLATNHKPRIRGTDHGIWRRIHYIPYTHTFTEEEKRDDFRDAVLLPEASGILNWMIEGCREWLQNGLKLYPPARVTEAAAEYRKDQDTVSQFVRACCEPNPNFEATLETIHSSYQSWMQAEYNWKGLGRRRFSEELERLGIHKGRDSKNITIFKLKGCWCN